MSTTVPTNRALTVATTARRLSLSEKTIYRLVRRGELPHLRVGILESALEPRDSE